jgi:CheY-like chemotaxis protein
VLAAGLGDLGKAASRVSLDKKNMSNRASLTILVVDDEEGMLKVAATILRREGYQIHTARDGREGITTLRENPGIALLFTDIKMPGIDGFMLADMAKVRRPDLKCSTPPDLATRSARGRGSATARSSKSPMIRSSCAKKYGSF